MQDLIVEMWDYSDVEVLKWHYGVNEVRRVIGGRYVLVDW